MRFIVVILSLFMNYYSYAGTARSPDIIFENTCPAEIYQKTLAFIKEKNLAFKSLRKNQIEISAPAPYRAILSMVVWENSLNQVGVAIKEKAGESKHLTQCKNMLLESMKTWGLKNISHTIAEPTRKPKIILNNISFTVLFQKINAFIEETKLSAKQSKSNEIEITAPAPYEAVLLIKFWINEHDKTGVAIEKISGKTEDFAECEGDLIEIMNRWDLESIVHGEFSYDSLLDKKAKIMQMLEQHDDLLITSHSLEEVTFVLNATAMSISYCKLSDSPNNFGVQINHICGNNFNTLYQQIVSILYDED